MCSVGLRNRELGPLRNNNGTGQQRPTTTAMMMVMTMSTHLTSLYDACSEFAARPYPLGFVFELGTDLPYCHQVFMGSLCAYASFSANIKSICFSCFDAIARRSPTIVVGVRNGSQHTGHTIVKIERKTNE